MTAIIRSLIQPERRDARHGESVARRDSRATYVQHKAWCKFVSLALAAIFVFAAVFATFATTVAGAGLLPEDDTAWVPVGPGVHHAVITSTIGGRLNSVQVLRVARDERYVSLMASLGRDFVEGTETVLAQARRLSAAYEQRTSGGSRTGSSLSDLFTELFASRTGGTSGTATVGHRTIVGGVNADFFASTPTAGLPIGLHVQDGEIVVSPNGRPAIGVTGDGSVVIGMPEMTGVVWRDELPEHLTSDDAGIVTSGMEELWLRAEINQVNRPPNGLGLVLYTPRYGTQTPPVQGIVVTLRGVGGGITSGRTYTGVVAKVEEAPGLTSIRAAIPSDGVVLAARGTAEVLLESLTIGEWVQLRVDLAEPFADVQHAVAGWPILVQDGVAVALNNGDALVSGRHPRTAVGMNDDYIFIVTADGRQPDWSEGMTLPELAQLMLALGATDAINLDGGGSTTMVVRPPGEHQPVVVNRPSDGSERAVANALFVVSTAPSTPLQTLLVRPEAPAALAGALVPLRLLGQDRYNNPVAVDADEVVWSVRGSGDVVVVPTENGDIPALATREPGTVTVTARLGTVTGTAEVDVISAVERIEVVPDIVHLAAGESESLEVRAFDGDGRLVAVRPGQLAWSATTEQGSGTAVRVDADGTVTAMRSGVAQVTARFGTAVGTASVTVDRAPVVLSDFETSGVWFANAVRAQSSFTLVGQPDPVHTGSRSGKLVYDLTVSQGGTAAAYVQATTPIPIPDRPRAIGVWVYGDASGHWLRANYIDGHGQRQVLDLTAVGGLDWTGWRFVQAEIPADAVLPLTFERVYVVEMHPERQTRGVLYFDDLVALYGQP